MACSRRADSPSIYTLIASHHACLPRDGRSRFHNPTLSSRDVSLPLLYQPATHLGFQWSICFRPTGSTTAALIFILHTVTHLLTIHPYVIVIALDFSDNSAFRYCSAQYSNKQNNRLEYTRLRLQLAGILFQWSSTLYNIWWAVISSSRHLSWNNPGI